MFLRNILLGFALLSTISCEKLDDWDSNSLQKVEVLTELITFWMQEADQLQKQVDHYKALEVVISKRMKLLEEKLELIEKENSDLTKKFLETETKLSEPELRCPTTQTNNKERIDNSAHKTDNDIDNTNQTIAALMKLLNSNKDQLLSCYKNVKSLEKDNSDTNALLSDEKKRVEELTLGIKEVDIKLKISTEQLESTTFNLNTCLADIMDKEGEIKELDAKLKMVQDKVEDVSNKCKVPRSENESVDLDRCLEKFEKERQKVWEKAWGNQDYNLCKKACDMMRNAACKLAFNFLPFKGYLLDCS